MRGRYFDLFAQFCKAPGKQSCSIAAAARLPVAAGIDPVGLPGVASCQVVKCLVEIRARLHTRDMPQLLAVSEDGSTIHAALLDQSMVAADHQQRGFASRQHWLQFGNAGSKQADAQHQVCTVDKCLPLWPRHFPKLGIGSCNHAELRVIFAE